jgi:hypothetical protein
MNNGLKMLYLLQDHVLLNSKYLFARFAKRIVTALKRRELKPGQNWQVAQYLQ